MKIKRFIAPDMRQAIRMVREEQGPDAVIISSQPVDGGIEIVSALDFDSRLVADVLKTAQQAETSVARESAKQAGKSSPITSRKARSAWTAVQPPSTPEPRDVQPEIPTLQLPERRLESAPVPGKPRVVWSQDTEVAMLHQELKGMRELLHVQLSRLAWGEFSRAEPVRAQCLKRLARLGFGQRLARELVMSLRETRDPDKAWRETLHRVAGSISISREDLIEAGGRVAVVGSTGSGKTTTIAKLAAQYVLRHGPRGVALVTTDCRRIGAQAQLQSFAQILDVAAYAVAEEELPETLARLSDHTLVLIDTAGCGAHAGETAPTLTTLLHTPGLKLYLTLAANAQRAALDETVRAFAHVGLAGAVMTRLDEAVSLGEVLSVIMRHRLPLAYVADGQRVPEDLHPARVSTLVTSALSLGARFENAARELAPTLPSLAAMAAAAGKKDAHARR